MSASKRAQVEHGRCGGGPDAPVRVFERGQDEARTLRSTGSPEQVDRRQLVAVRALLYRPGQPVEAVAVSALEQGRRRRQADASVGVAQQVPEDREHVGVADVGQLDHGLQADLRVGVREPLEQLWHACTPVRFDEGFDAVQQNLPVEGAEQLPGPQADLRSRVTLVGRHCPADRLSLGEEESLGLLPAVVAPVPQHREENPNRDTPAPSQDRDAVGVDPARTNHDQPPPCDVEVPQPGLPGGVPAEELCRFRAGEVHLGHARAARDEGLPVSHRRSHREVDLGQTGDPARTAQRDRLELTLGGEDDHSLSPRGEDPGRAEHPCPGLSESFCRAASPCGRPRRSSPRRRRARPTPAPSTRRGWSGIRRTPCGRGVPRRIMVAYFFRPRSHRLG